MLTLFALDTSGTYYGTDLLDLINESETTVTEQPATNPRAAYLAQPHLTYIATMTNGQVATRSSRTMEYTHAVQVTSKRDGTTFVLSWHKSAAGAAKQTGGRTADYYSDIQILLVTAHPYSSKEAKAARAASK